MEFIVHTRIRPCSAGVVRVLHGLPTARLLACPRRHSPLKEEAVSGAAREDEGACSHEGRQVGAPILLKHVPHTWESVLLGKTMGLSDSCSASERNMLVQH